MTIICSRLQVQTCRLGGRQAEVDQGDGRVEEELRQGGWEAVHLGQSFKGYRDWDSKIEVWDLGADLDSSLHALFLRRITSHIDR